MRDETALDRPRRLRPYTMVASGVVLLALILVFEVLPLESDIFFAGVGTMNLLLGLCELVSGERALLVKALRCVAYSALVVGFAAAVAVVDAGTS